MTTFYLLTFFIFNISYSLASFDLTYNVDSCVEGGSKLTTQYECWGPGTCNCLYDYMSNFLVFNLNLFKGNCDLCGGNFCSSPVSCEPDSSCLCCNN